MTNSERRILLFTGDGKGKTTAAMGMAMRAAGHGMKVLAVQFVKSDDSSGELFAAKKFDNFEIIQTGLGFLPREEGAEMEKHRAAARAGLEVAEKAVADGKVEALVLDEVCFAVARGLIEESAVLNLLEKTGGLACVAMTGRGATQGLIDAADTATEMKMLKHGYDSGKQAKKGVEF